MMIVIPWTIYYCCRTLFMQTNQGIRYVEVVIRRSIKSQTP